MYSQLHCTTNYSFLTGASHPQEYVMRAADLGYKAIAITDECSLAGIVKAYIATKSRDIKLIIGSEFVLSNGCRLVAIAPDRKAYAELSGFITLARRRAEKGEYEAHLEDLRFRLQTCLLIWRMDVELKNIDFFAKELASAFKKRLWLGVNEQYQNYEPYFLRKWYQVSENYHIPLLALPTVTMHSKSRKMLLDSVCAIKNNCSIEELGASVAKNSECFLKSCDSLYRLYDHELIAQSNYLADQCNFSLNELRYQYPEELVPQGLVPIEYLRNLVEEGCKERWPEGENAEVRALIEKELQLIEEMHYEYYFLTVHDVVRYARSQNILCQGRGSAANSVVCYCLFVTEIAPGQINVLFERFISKERNEPPDIDVDFEHQRREEVIQYIYRKYTRQHAALAASVVTYRSRSAVRDIGKALGLDTALIDHLAKSLAWWDRKGDLKKRIESAGLQYQQKTMLLFYQLVNQILGFPRHLSQHVGGFVITQDKVSDLVPMENASMPDRTVIQWDKEDLEAVGLLKVDVLALGMLTALRQCIEYVNQYEPSIKSMQTIPREDKATYDMLSTGDSLGVFQVESRAQMSMLPRLKPQNFYDLVIEIAIVRPGPIQGDMVHPYLRRRDGLEPITYENDAIKSVLDRTLGIPIFQEQAIRLAMVAAGFTGGEADQLRRAMASWGKNGNLLQFEEKFINGMLDNDYSLDFAERLFRQIKGFGGYGFPESHSASFALLCYASSWFKCHHPAAFYCALLNSQPMGFYSPSQLLQDAQRHNVPILAVDVNHSDYENKIEKFNQQWGVRLGFCRINSLDKEAAMRIVESRKIERYDAIDELAYRAQLSKNEVSILAAADALANISGKRHQALWGAVAVQEPRPLLSKSELNKISEKSSLWTPKPNLEENIVSDYEMLGHSLRPHVMALLRHEYPFNRCKQQAQLKSVGNKRFVRVAGLVTGRQRPGTAKGTLFLTLEDETGNINIIVWKATQELFRQELLTGKLLVINGRLETEQSVIHIIAGRILDYSARLERFAIKSRDFH